LDKISVKSKNQQIVTALVLLALPLVGACSHKQVKSESAEAPAAAMSDVSSSDLGNAYGLQTVHFGFDSSLLNKETKSELKANADILKKNPALRIQIEGHCDRMGGIQYNLALGQRRADSVKHFLVDMGVGDAQLSTVSFGKEKLLDTAATEEADAKNRRANFVVTKSMM
jgi:peptidoglycan-associated lipoprotein